MPSLGEGPIAGERRFDNQDSHACVTNQSSVYGEAQDHAHGKQAMHTADRRGGGARPRLLLVPFSGKEESSEELPGVFRGKEEASEEFLGFLRGKEESSEDLLGLFRKKERSSEDLPSLFRWKKGSSEDSQLWR